MSRSNLLALAFCILGAAPALADSVEPDFHIAAGAELMGGRWNPSADFRADAVAGIRLSGLTLDLGATFGAGVLSLAKDSDQSFVAVGPEAQVGYTTPDGFHLFVNFAEVHADVTTMGSDWGQRGAVGMNWVRPWLRWQMKSDTSSGHMNAVFSLLAPQQAAITYENDGGLPRTGFALGWGI